MATRGDLHDRIADDLDRSDLTAQIRAAVDDAIAHYESERFAFNEASGFSVSFAAGVAVVALASLSVRFTRIDRLRLRNSSNLQDLQDLAARDYACLMDRQDSRATCRPAAYCIHAQAINFDALPDQDYTGVIDGVRCVSATASLSPVANASAWFNEGRRLIRARAKVELCAHVVRDPEQASVMAALEQREFRSLKQKLNTNNSGRVRPTPW